MLTVICRARKKHGAAIAREMETALQSVIDDLHSGSIPQVFGRASRLRLEANSNPPATMGFFAAVCRAYSENPVICSFFRKMEYTTREMSALSFGCVTDHCSRSTTHSSTQATGDRFQQSCEPYPKICVRYLQEVERVGSSETTGAVRLLLSIRHVDLLTALHVRQVIPAFCIFPPGPYGRS
jgi:hypothetical protein